MNAQITQAEAQSILLHNARGWHLHTIEAATDTAFAFGGAGINSPTPTHAILMVDPQLLPPIDLESNDIPGDTARAFRHLANKLLAMADQVETVQPEPLRTRPQAFITMDSDGKVIGENLLLLGAGEVENAYHDITGETAYTCLGDVWNYPKLRRQYHRLKAIAHAEPLPADEAEAT